MNWKIEKEKINIILAIFITGLILLFSSNTQILLHIISIWMLVIVATITVKMDIFHPYCWFSFFFGLYSTSYALLFSIQKTSTIYGYDKEAILYQWIALVVFLLIIPCKRVRYIDNFKDISEHEIGTIFICLKSTLIFIAFGIIYFINSGYTNKSDILDNMGFATKFIYTVVYFAILLYGFSFYEMLKEKIKINYSIFLLAFLIISLFGITVGERDYEFRIILITVMILFVHKKIKRWMIYCMLPIGLSLLPLTHMYKFFILTGSITVELDMEQFLIWILEGEFISAGRNLQILIQHNMCNYFEGKSLIADLLSTFYNFGLSNQVWFNERFFPESNLTQYGFTLVGEGYLNGGILGVIFIYSFTSLLIRFFYLNSMKNSYWMVAYLYMLPLFIYVTRADLGNLISPMLKHVFLGVFIIKILSKIKLKRGF